MPITTPSRGHVEDLHVLLAEDRLDQRGHEAQGKEAVDHRGNASQDFQHRFQRAPRLGRRVFAQVDGDHQPNRQGHQHADEAGQHRGIEQRENAELHDRGLPGGAGEELPEGRLGPEKELDGVENEHEDDARGDQHRDGAGQPQEDLDDGLAGPPLLAQLAGDVVQGDRRRAQGQAIDWQVFVSLLLLLHGRVAPPPWRAHAHVRIHGEFTLVHVGMRTPSSTSGGKGPAPSHLACRRVEPTV